MEMIRLISPKLLRLLLVTSMITLVGCGSDDDDSTNVTISTPELQQEQEGTVPTTPTVVVNNRINNVVRVTNRRTRVERNRYHWDWQCRNVAPVIHKQFIHISVNCPTVAQNDTNGDGFLDPAEIDQAVGPRVLPLDSNVESPAEDQFPSGSSYDYDQSALLPVLRQFVPQGQDYIVMIHGASPDTVVPATYANNTGDPVHLTIPIACKVFKATVVSDGTTGTTGTTDTTGTTGTTGTTDTTGTTGTTGTTDTTGTTGTTGTTDTTGTTGTTGTTDTTETPAI